MFGLVSGCSVDTIDSSVIHEILFVLNDNFLCVIGQFEEVGDRMNMPEIRGGLNGSIADILEASGYGTETDFKVDEEIG